jgi:hypothetical protein
LRDALGTRQAPRVSAVRQYNGGHKR